MTDRELIFLLARSIKCIALMVGSREGAAYCDIVIQEAEEEEK